MSERVTDTSQALKRLTSGVASTRKVMDAMHAENVNLRRTVERLRVENRALCKQLEEYGEPKKNSNNSSTPPSKKPMKDETLRRTNSLRRKSGLKPGRQPGHGGHLKELVTVPDVIEGYGSDSCREYGRDLSDIGKGLDYVSQVVDLPTMTPIVTEYRHCRKVCTCGCCNRGYTPRKRGNQIVFGRDIRAIVAYLNVVQRVPYERLASLMAEMSSTHMNRGTIGDMVQEATRESKPAISLLEEVLKKSVIVNSGESGCYNSKKLNWVWIAQTMYITLCFRATGHSPKVLEDKFGESLKNMMAVTDRRDAHFVLNFLDHQVCLTHLLREPEYLTEPDPKQNWSKDVAGLLRKAIHEKNEHPTDVIEKKTQPEKLGTLLQVNLLHLKNRFERMHKGLFKCRDYIFNFLGNPRIPSDNSANERGIRKLKTKQKIFGTFRSDSGADAFFAIHSISDTAWKNHQSQLNATNTILSLQDGRWRMAIAKQLP